VRPSDSGSFEILRPHISGEGDETPWVVRVQSWGNGISRSLGTLRQEHPEAAIFVQAPYEVGEVLSWARPLSAIGIGSLIPSESVSGKALRAALPDPLALGAVLDGWVRLCHPELSWSLSLAPSHWVVGALEHSTIEGYARRLHMPLPVLKRLTRGVELPGRVRLEPPGTILRYTRALLMGVVSRKYSDSGRKLAVEYFPHRYRSLSGAFKEAFGCTLGESRKGWGWESLARTWVQAIHRSVEGENHQTGAFGDPLM